MQTDSGTVYKKWSIEQGDYVRKGLSKDDKYYKAKVSLGIKILIISLTIITTVSGVILYLQNS